MKRAAITMGILAITIFCQAQGTKHANGSAKGGNTVAVTDLDGNWKGQEKCRNISAPVATININIKNNTTVELSGVYSSTGLIEGTVKNGVITVVRQLVKDPLFNNLAVEGKLTLSADHKSLTGYWTIFNNDASDNCTAVYLRAGK